MLPLIPSPTPNAPRFSKQRRNYLDPIAIEKNLPRFIPAPAPSNSNHQLPLDVVIPHEAAAAQAAGKLVLHAVGDTGGIHGDQTEVAVAEAMEAQITAAASDDRPAFSTTSATSSTTMG